MEIKNRLFYQNGRPFFPVMGEFQYSRTFLGDWDTDLKKMKALGINTVATYVFWIHHEESEGEFDFSGNRNIRLFLELCQKNNLSVCLRIGPWVHAECRNGGFPDWILEKPCRTRTNDPLYLQYVRRYFTRLYQECKGMMEKDGGPITSIQIENEYSQWGRQGPDLGNVHMRVLNNMLREIGFDVSVYFATGWGDASLGDCVPVWGAYCEAPWEFTQEELPPFDCYLFSPNPNDKNIGSDTGIKDFDLSAAKSKFPYATVEIGGGIQMTKMRRPIIRPEDNGALITCQLGSGVDALGYYVFHGGIHPVGKTTMQEYRRVGNIDAGFACDLPERDYDFQAPISQYGRIHPMGREIKTWNQFASSFSSILLGSEVIFPFDNATDASDLKSPRYSLRKKGNGGFLFFNRYVRHYEVAPMLLSSCLHELGLENVGFTEVEIQNGQFGAFPFNVTLGEGELAYATATPFLVLNQKDVFFFASTDHPVIQWKKEGGHTFLLTKEEARNCFVFPLEDGEHVFMGEAEFYQNSEGVYALYGNSSRLFRAYPALASLPQGVKKIGEEGLWTLYEIEGNIQEIPFQKQDKYLSKEELEITVDLEDGNRFEQIYLSLDFNGDSCDLLLNGQKENDRLYSGASFEVGLRQYDFPKRVQFFVHGAKEGEPFYVEKPLHYENGVACSDLGIRVEGIQKKRIA